MRNELFHKFNKMVQEHNCYISGLKYYMACQSDRKKGNLMLIRVNRKGNLTVEIKKSTWNQLVKPYRALLENMYNGHENSKGYIQLDNVDNVETMRVLLLIALR